MLSHLAEVSMPVKNTTANAITKTPAPVFSSRGRAMLTGSYSGVVAVMVPGPDVRAGNAVPYRKIDTIGGQINSTDSAIN